jgi:hypothetical protein
MKYKENLTQEEWDKMLNKVVDEASKEMVKKEKNSKWVVYPKI